MPARALTVPDAERMKIPEAMYNKRHEEASSGPAAQLYATTSYVTAPA